MSKNDFTKNKNKGNCIIAVVLLSARVHIYVGSIACTYYKRPKFNICVNVVYLIMYARKLVILMFKNKKLLVFKTPTFLC